MAIWSFADMYSGGDRKAEHEVYAVIAKDRDEACARFTTHTGRDPDNVTCPCCGADYNVRTHESERGLEAYAGMMGGAPYWIWCDDSALARGGG